jgi:hypothetical protein
VTKQHADEIDVEGTEAFLSKHGLDHLRVRKRGDALTLLSGPTSDPIPHARLRKVTRQWWTLEMPTHTGRWEKTGLRAPRTEVLETLVQQFPWTLAPIG